MATPTQTPEKPRLRSRLWGWTKNGASKGAKATGQGAKKAGSAYWSWSKARWIGVRDGEKLRSKRVLDLAALITGWMSVLGGTVFSLVVLYTLFLIPFTPRVATLEQALELHPSLAVSSDGTELTQYARSGRQWVELDEISPHVIDALLATEDRRFYSHGGIDLRRTAGAVVRTLTGDREGGSSLTQQLARNLFPEAIGREASVKRKLKEAITAVKIERVYEKDQILEIYLNSVPFLYNAVGIERAAHTYFSKDADDLTIPEATTLVAMLKGTSYYNPRQQPERALARRNLVLDLMVVTDRLEAEEAERLKATPLGLRFELQTIRNSRAPHFTEHVRKQMEAWCEDNGYNLYGDGLRVVTTLDWDLQRVADESVTRFGNALQTVADVEWGRRNASVLGRTTAPYYNARGSVTPFGHYWSSKTAVVDQFVRETREYERAVAGGASDEDALASLRADAEFMTELKEQKTRLQVGFTAIDPHTGHVRAWVGSRDYRTAPYDHVARARRQPGSTFKPFVYARALEEGWEPEDTVADDSVEVRLASGEVWTPTNADGSITGDDVTLRDALAQSRNTVTAALGQKIGARDVARLARRVGVNRSELDAVPSIVLGTEEVSLLEMTSAYATFASAGMYREPVTILRIEDREGNVLEEFAPREKEALRPEVAHTVVDMMRGVVDEGTGRQLRTEFGVRADVAGKTGTTQDGVDGWFVAIHPDLAMGAWVGFDDPRVTFRTSYWQQGGHNALRVVGEFSGTLLRRGLLSPEPRFPTLPERQDDGVLGRLGEWFAGLLGDPAMDEAPPDPSDRTPEADDPGWNPGRWRVESNDRDDPISDIVDDAMSDFERFREGALDELDPRDREIAEDLLDEAARQFEREAARAARDAERALRDLEREAARAARDILR
ncbi:MAG: PBP1A family penicillin-binding protein [Bacteroidota bacterium]